MAECWIRKPPVVYRLAELGRTALELSRDMRIHPVTLSNYMNGKKPIPYALAKLLCELLEVEYSVAVEERFSPATTSAAALLAAHGLNRSAEGLSA